MWFEARKLKCAHSSCVAECKTKLYQKCKLKLYLITTEASEGGGSYVASAWDDNDKSVTELQ